eukprot:scaffold23987_cov67-Phaeocystis_antarctica.AAC.1
MHEASRNAVFQAMLAWEEDGGLGGGAKASGGGGFGPEVEVAPVSWDAGDEDGGGNTDGAGGGGVAKVELTLSAAVG